MVDGTEVISRQFASGDRKTVTPARSAAMSFSSIPPIGPTFPDVSIVPVPATFRPRNKSSGVSYSITPRVKIIPPLGPPVSFTSNVINFGSTLGNCG